LYGKHFHQWKRKRKSWVKILVGFLFVVAFAALGWWIGGLAWGSWIGATIGLGVGIWVVDKYLRGKWRPAWSHTYRYNIGSYQFA
jgi:O-antigen/teichoic acid export membrane protein